MTMKWNDGTYSSAAEPDPDTCVWVEFCPRRDENCGSYWAAHLALEGLATVEADIAFKSREDAKAWAERVYAFLDGTRDD